jgi:hypothetical protein
MGDHTSEALQQFCTMIQFLGFRITSIESVTDVYLWPHAFHGHDEDGWDKVGQQKYYYYYTLYTVYKFSDSTIFTYLYYSIAIHVYTGQNIS